MGGLPGGRLLGILNPNSAHSNTTWPPDATVAVCVEPQAAHAGIAAPRSRHIASSDCNQRLIFPEPRRTARSEQRRVGKDCVRTCSSLWSLSHLKNNTTSLSSTFSFSHFIISTY